MAVTAPRRCSRLTLSRRSSCGTAIERHGYRAQPNGLPILTFFLAVTLFLAAQTPAFGQSWPQISFADPIGGFHHPTHVAVARDGSGRLFVTEKAGVIRIVRDGVVLPTQFLDITCGPETQGNQGLLSVAFPPDYASRQHFYVNYVTASNTVIVARCQVTADPNVADPNSEQIVLTTGPFETNGNHFGGELAFGPDGYLYFGVGTGNGVAPDNRLVYSGEWPIMFQCEVAQRGPDSDKCKQISQPNFRRGAGDDERNSVPSIEQMPPIQQARAGWTLAGKVT